VSSANWKEPQLTTYSYSQWDHLILVHTHTFHFTCPLQMVPAMYVDTDSEHNTAKSWNQKLYTDTASTT
jgi:hypothetical protein